MKKPNVPVFESLRRDYHAKICGKIHGYWTGAKGFTKADGNGRKSCDLAEGMVANIGLPTCSEPETAQTAAKLFTDYTVDGPEAGGSGISVICPSI